MSPGRTSLSTVGSVPGDLSAAEGAQRDDGLRRVVVPIFFVALVLLGFFIFPDYGMSWDESTSRTNGMVSLKHVLKLSGTGILKEDAVLKEFKVPLNSYSDRDYGVAFEIPLAAAERLLALNDSRSQYLFRHLATYLIFVLGVFAIYQLAKRRFSDWRWGLFASVLLVLSPRFFAEGFYNDKDIVFMVFFAIAMNSMIVFLEKPTLRHGLLHALASALAIDVRVMGIILPIITLGIMGLRMIQMQVPLRRTVVAVGGYLTVTAFVVFLMWPWLWSAPWSHFGEAIRNMSHFRWHESNFYLGAYVPASGIPWHYVPVWIGITTPILYLALFLLGIVSILYRIVRQRTLWSDTAGMQDLLFLGIFAGAVMSVIVLHSVLYDGWRQLYFIYPAFLLIAAKGLHDLWMRVARSRVLKILVGVVVLVALGNTLVWMVAVHPLQNLYFNLLAGPNWGRRFDMDYWGLSNRKAVEYILSVDKRPVIKLWPLSDTPILNGAAMLVPADRDRIVLADSRQDADYLVNNYRFLKGNVYKGIDPTLKLLHQVIIDDQAVVSVYKRVD